MVPMVVKNLLISARFTPYEFLLRCKFSTLTTRQPMVEFYLLTYSRTHAFRYGCQKKNPALIRIELDFRTSWGAGYLLDHTGDKRHVLFFSFFFHLTYSRWTSSLPSCLWSQRIFPSLPGSRLTFVYRNASSALLQLVKPMVELYLLTFPRFPLRKKEHKSYFGKNRTHYFRTSRCAVYLLDHSGEYCIRDTC